MRNPTLIPDAGSYGVAILVLYSLGSAALTNHARALWPLLRRLDFATLYAAQMVVVCAWGFLIFEPSALLGRDPRGWLATLPLGLACGVFAGWCDRRVLRWFARRAPARAARKPATGRRVVTVAPGGGGGRAEVRASVSLASGRAPNPAPASAAMLRFLLVAMVAIAVLEELIYRGFLVEVCRMVPGPILRGLALAGVVGAFALAHLTVGGWVQVLVKLPLSALAMLATLATGTVLAAVVAHVVFNVQVGRELARQGFPIPRSGEPGWD